MTAKILFHIENKYLKGILLKSIASTGLGFLDIIDIDDMNIKLEAYGNDIALAIFEITQWNMNALKIEIDRLKSLSTSIPMIAVVSDDTSDIVTFAMRAGMRDVLLLPQKRDMYAQIIRDKMEPYYNKLTQKNNKLEAADKIINNTNIKEAIELELKHAKRSGYPISFVMAHFNVNEPDFAKGSESIKTLLRDTDKVYMVDYQTYIGIFPFTTKDHIPVIEQKFRAALKKVINASSVEKSLFIFGITYPNDETDMVHILKRLEKGISNSMVINSIRTPLNNLSKSDIENYKQKIKQYKKFF